MAEGKIYVGSRLWVALPAVDLRPDGEEPLTLHDLGVRVWDPRNVERAEGVDFTLEEDEDGPGILFASGQLDLPGIWKVQGDEGGYLAEPITWRVHRGPGA